MVSLYEKILRIKQNISDYGSSHLIMDLDLNFIDKMEFDSNDDRDFKEAVLAIDVLATKVVKDIEDYGSLMEITNLYAEAYILSKLRSMLSIKKIPETSSKTPDFKVKFRDGDLYIELKSLNMFEGGLKHKKIMHDGLDRKIDIENQISKGEQVGFAEQEIQPYKVDNKDYDPRSPRMVIEALIDKISQNIKADQYALGDTILLVDLSSQLPILSLPYQSIQTKFFDVDLNAHVSGELWSVAFGKVGDDIFRSPDFPGAHNSDGRLQKQGVLISHPYIKGIIYHVNGEFFSVAEITESNARIRKLMDYVSKNSNFMVLE